MDVDLRTGGTQVNPHAPTAMFEEELCRYTGAKHAVAVNSCTMAILLAVAWHLRGIKGGGATEVVTADGYHAMAWEGSRRISIPRPGYISVPQAIVHAGGWPVFRDEEWSGCYQLQPLPVWDCARRFTSGMFVPGRMQCVSFHASKILGLEQGGAILHDNDEADGWFRRARFDGRTPGIAPKDDPGIGTLIGWHCYMNPSTAAMGLLRLYSLPRHNADLPNDDYPDLSTLSIYQR